MFPDIYVPPAIHDLDLSTIKRKLMDPGMGPGWDKEYCEQVHREYLRFLTLVQHHPDRPILPSRTIDEFWHAHILDTRKYQLDCQRTLGRFLHHTPNRNLALVSGPDPERARGPEKKGQDCTEKTRSGSAKSAREASSYEKMHEEVWRKTLRLYEKQYEQPAPTPIWDAMPPCD